MLHGGNELGDPLFNARTHQCDALRRERFRQDAPQPFVIGAVGGDHVIEATHPNEGMILRNFSLLQGAPMTPITGKSRVGNDLPESVMMLIAQVLMLPGSETPAMGPLQSRAEVESRSAGLDEIAVMSLSQNALPFRMH
ncbi:hypothetical protein [Lonsdalea britannica]|uniref:hypothetical protein n=1 Tax=Lonsdalea britannica TaxID=1082704 RepID=UPI001C38D0A5|nr:hypothetical protein [Lonsdalea britannica]